MPAGIAPSSQKVLEAFAGTGGLEHELSRDAAGQVERLFRLRETELTGHKAVGIGCTVVGNGAGHKTWPLTGLDQDVRAQSKVQARGVDQGRVKWRNHAGFAQGADLKVGKDHVRGS